MNTVSDSLFKAHLQPVKCMYSLFDRALWHNSMSLTVNDSGVTANFVLLPGETAWCWPSPDPVQVLDQFKHSLAYCVVIN